MNNWSKRGKTIYWVICGALFCLIIILIFKGCALQSGSGSSSGSKKTKDSYGNDQAVAIVIAKDKVKEQLKSPSSAKFSNVSASLSGNTWTVTGSVDAQNSFGATIRNTFKVTITFTSSEKYTYNCSIS